MGEYFLRNGKELVLVQPVIKRPGRRKFEFIARKADFVPIMNRDGFSADGFSVQGGSVGGPVIAEPVCISSDFDGGVRLGDGVIGHDQIIAVHPADAENRTGGDGIFAFDQGVDGLGEASGDTCFFCIVQRFEKHSSIHVSRTGPVTAVEGSAVDAGTEQYRIQQQADKILLPAGLMNIAQHMDADPTRNTQHLGNTGGRPLC